MSYGTFAIDILRSDLGFYREVDGAWVVVYQAIKGTGPIYLRLTDEISKGWTAGSIQNCTLFETYEQACKAALMSDYVRKVTSLGRVVRLRIKVDVQVDMLEDRPIGVLDALAEL